MQEMELTGKRRNAVPNMSITIGGIWLEGKQKRKSKRYTAREGKLDYPRKKGTRQPTGTSTSGNIERNTEKRSERGTAGIITKTEKKDLKRGEYTARKNGGREMKCANCNKEIDRPQTIYKHQDEIYCSPACLAEALLEKAWDDVEEIWFDTEENMRVCAMEEKAEW